MKKALLLLTSILALIIAQPNLQYQNEYLAGIQAEAKAMTLMNDSVIAICGFEFWGSPDFSEAWIALTNRYDGEKIRDTLIGTGFPHEDQCHDIEKSSEEGALRIVGWQQNGYFNFQVFYFYNLTLFRHIIWGNPEAVDRGRALCIGPNDEVATTGEVPNWYTLTQGIPLNIWDRNGYLILQTSWDSTGQDCGRAIIYHDHHYYIVGGADEKISQISDGIILKFREDGTLIWARVPGLSSDDEFYDVVYNPIDNVLACAGSCFDINQHGGWLHIINLDGVYILNKLWYTTEYQRYTSIDIDTANRRYFLGGFIGSLYNAFVRCVNFNGDTLWTWRNAENYTKINDIMYLGDGKLAFCGQRGVKAWWGVLSEDVNIAETPPTIDNIKVDNLKIRMYNILGQEVYSLDKRGVYFIRKGEHSTKSVIVK